mmetsp:Transcript_14596/g.14224  ORF Transcript_14596/g.14224 Transcript_14596/m.14224 type:complete len:85 (-) Transcript_14596:286-540(-)
MSVEDQVDIVSNLEILRVNDDYKKKFQKFDENLHLQNILNGKLDPEKQFRIKSSEELFAQQQKRALKKSTTQIYSGQGDEEMIN